MIKTEGISKTRVICPYCKGFLLEVRPRLEKGQAIVKKCLKCNLDVEVLGKRERISKIK